MTAQLVRDRLPQTEKQWLQTVRELARLLGWTEYHTHDSRRSTPGFPDLVLMRDRVIFVELKNDKGRLSSHQRYWLDVLRTAHAETYVWRPADYAAAVETPETTDRMTTTHPSPQRGRCTASPRTPLAVQPTERTSDVNIKRTGLALAISAAVLNPGSQAGAHHVNRAQLEQLVDATFGPAAAHARRIVACESSWDHTAKHRNRNGTVDYGLFQLNSGGTLQSLGLTGATALDPVANVRAAFRLYRARGWRPWACSRGRR